MRGVGLLLAFCGDFSASEWPWWCPQDDDDDDGAAALWEGYRGGLESPTAGALLNLCGGHLDYPQIFRVSRIVSCEVRRLCLQSPVKCWWNFCRGYGMVLMAWAELIPVSFHLRYQLEPHLWGFPHKTVPDSGGIWVSSSKAHFTNLITKTLKHFVHGLFELHIFFQHFGDLMPQCRSWPWGGAWVTPLSWSLSLAAGGRGCQGAPVVWAVCWHLVGLFPAMAGCSRPSMAEVVSHPGQKLSAGVGAAPFDTALERSCCDATVLLTKGCVSVLLPLQWQLYCASQSCGYDPRWLQWGMVAARRRRSQ